MMWRAAGWAGTDRGTSSASVLVTTDKLKHLKFNGGQATERREAKVVCGYVCGGPVVSLGCHTHGFSQWDGIAMLIKSTAYLKGDGSGSHCTSGKGVSSISLCFVARVFQFRVF